MIGNNLISRQLTKGDLWRIFENFLYHFQSKIGFREIEFCKNLRKKICNFVWFNRFNEISTKLDFVKLNFVRTKEKNLQF